MRIVETDHERARRTEEMHTLTISGSARGGKVVFGSTGKGERGRIPAYAQKVSANHLPIILAQGEIDNGPVQTRVQIVIFAS